jgi:hypothetical protein
MTTTNNGRKETESKEGTDGWLAGWLAGCGWIDGWMDGWMDGRRRTEMNSIKIAKPVRCKVCQGRLQDG